MKMSFRSLLLIGCCLVLSSCSLKKTAEDTAQTTKEMNNTTKEMNENTKELKATSENLREKTDALEAGMTYDVSHDRMSLHLDRLFFESARDNVGIMYSLWSLLFGKNEDPDMLAEAGFTIYAMWFQFWKGQSGEDLQELDQRLEVGMELLFDRMFKHVPRDAQIDVTRPDVSYKGIAALGAKLDDIHERYVKGLERRGLPRMSLYDYIVQALRNRDAITRTEKTPLAAAKVLQWENEAVYMLQLRHNIFPVMVLARMTDFQDRKDLKRFWMWWRGQKIDIKRINPEQLKLWTVWLNKASQTRKDLREMGIKPEYNSMMMGLVEGVDFGQKEILKKQNPNERELIERDFAVAYQRVVNESKAEERTPNSSYDFSALAN